MVHLGKRARLLAGDWISFQPEAVQALVDGDSGTPTDTPDVLRAVAQRSPGSAAVKVQAVLTAPSAVNARCSMLRFSTELSSGAAGRSMLLEWRLGNQTTGLNVAQLEDLEDKLDAASLSSSTVLEIDPSAQAIEGNAQIEIEVRMTNWQNYSSTAHALAQVSADSLSPPLIPATVQEMVLDPAKPLELAVKVQENGCVEGAVEIQWSALTRHPGADQDPSQAGLRLREYTFGSGTLHGFRASAFYKASPAHSRHLDFIVAVPEPPRLVPVISGPTTVSRSCNFTLRSRSFDEQIPPSERALTRFGYKWTCDSEHLPCDLQSKASTLSVQGGDVEAGIYKITLHVWREWEDMSKAASTTSTIRVLPHQVPTVTLETSWIDGQMLSQVTGSVNATAVLDPQCDRGEDIHWQWVLLDGANWTLLRYLKSEPRELNESITTLDFPSYSLEKAGVYYFALSTVPEQRLALGQVVDIVDDRMIAISPSFRVDGPPELGVVEVNPPAGEAVTTSFTITTHSWQDEEEERLEYSFYALNASKDPQELDFSNTFNESYFSKHGGILLRSWAWSSISLNWSIAEIDDQFAAAAQVLQASMSTVNGQQMLNTVNAIYKSNATQSLSHLLLALKVAAQNVDATVEILRELSWVTSALVTDDAADEVNLLEASDLLSKYIELSLAPNTNPAGEETLATILRAISSVNQARSRLGLSEASNVSQDVSHRVSELGLAMLKVPDQSVQAREGWTVNADDITLEVIPSSGRRVSTFFHDSYPFTIEDPSSEKLDARSGLVKVLEIGTEGSFLDSVWITFQVEDKPGMNAICMRTGLGANQRWEASTTVVEKSEALDEVQEPVLDLDKLMGFQDVPCEQRDRALDEVQEPVLDLDELLGFQAEVPDDRPEVQQKQEEEEEEEFGFSVEPSPADELMEESLQQFCSKWQLDAEAQAFLRSLDAGALEVVIRDFAPHEGTQDVAGKLYSFAKGISRQPRQEELEAFIQKWSLDVSTAKWVRELPQEVKDALVRDFEPKEEPETKTTDDTQNIMGKLKGFARSILSRHQSVSGSAVAANGDRRLEEFVQRWGVQARPPPEQPSAFALRTKVLEQFDPKGDTMNINGRLCSFARSVADRLQLSTPPVPGLGAAAAAAALGGGHTPQVVIPPAQLGGLPQLVSPLAAFGGMDPLNSFFLMPQVSLPMALSPQLALQQAQLAAAGAAASGVDPEVQNIVMAEFSPAAGTASLDGKLQTFARSVLERFQDPSRPSAAAASANPSIAEFARKWALDEALGAGWVWEEDPDAVRFLETVPEQPLQTVLGEFQPRAGTRSMTGKLKAFAHTIMEAQGFPVIREGGGGAGGHHVELSEQQFLQKWGVAENPMVLDCPTGGADYDIRSRVFRDFEPAPQTMDVAGKLCSFAKSVARGKGGGKGFGAFGMGMPGMGMRLVCSAAATGQLVLEIAEKTGDGGAKCFDTLVKAVSNVLEKPHEFKYRELRRGSQGLDQVDAQPAASMLLRRLGFQEWRWAPTG
eukprot:g29033.t2